MRNEDIKMTRSPSGSTMKTMDVPNYGNSKDRITEAGIDTADISIKVSDEVQYKEYENDKRMTEDFAEKDADETGLAPFDGTKEIGVGSDDNRSDINTKNSL